MFRGHLSPLDFSHEAILLKAAVLYADRVVLASPKLLLVSFLERFATAGFEARLPALIRVVQELPESRTMLKDLRELEAIVGNRDGIRRLKKLGLLDGLRDQDRQMEREFHNLLGNPGLAEIHRAEKAGVVVLDPLGESSTPPMSYVGETIAGIARDTLKATRPDLDDALAHARSRPIVGLDSSRVTDRFAETILAALDPATGTLPLFDEAAARLAESGSELLRQAGSRVRASSEGALGTKVISYMDTLGAAPMDEVIDVRRQMAGPLTTFRAEISRCSEILATEPYSPDLEHEAQRLWRQRVAPALEELRETRGQLGIKSTSAAELEKGAPLARDAVIAFTISGVANLDQLFQAAIAAAIPAAQVIGSVAQRRARVQAELRKNAFYFVFEAQRRLK